MTATGIGFSTITDPNSVELAFRRAGVDRVMGFCTESRPRSRMANSKQWSAASHRTCSDSGRAINSGEKSWPNTLQGKVKEFYDRYQTFGKPEGFRLKAMIISFPNGMPGDVGFFLNWGSDLGT